MPQLPWIAQSYQSRSLPLDAQRCVNFFAESAPQDAESKVSAFGCPGIYQAWGVGTGPINNMHLMNDILYVVSGQQLWSIAPGAAPTLIGTLGVAGRCNSADNGAQIVWVDGTSGWVFQLGGVSFATSATAAAGATTLLFGFTATMTAGDPVTVALDNGNTFTTSIASVLGDTQITLTSPLPYQASSGARVIDGNVLISRISAPAFMPANTVTYFDGYFVFDAANTNEFFLSAINDGTQYSGGDFASAEASSDLVQGVVMLHEQLFVLGQQTIEVWYDAGSLDFPFARFDGAFIQRGIRAPNAFAIQDNTLFFFGDDGVFYRLNGFMPERVSTHATEHAWTLQDTLNAYCFTYTQEGHKFVVLMFPTTLATWVYDVATGLWHERESWDQNNNSLGRWRVNNVMPYFGTILVGDAFSNQIGVLSFDVYTEYFNTIRGLLTSPPFHNDRKRLFMPRFELLVESGVGVPAQAFQTSIGYQVNGIDIGHDTQTTVFAVQGPAPNGFPATFRYALYSAWIEFPNDPNAYLDIGFAPQGPHEYGVSIGYQNNVANINAYDSNGAVIGGFTVAPSSGSSVVGWAHVIFSIDAVGNIVQFYVNDAPWVFLGSNWSSTNQISNGSSQNCYIFLASSSTAETDFCLGDVYLTAPSSFFDLTVTANRRKFIDANGNPVSLGPNGSLPTGTQPIVFLTVASSGSPSDFLNNRGTGGAFALSGPPYYTLTFCANGPYPPALPIGAGTTPTGADPQIMLDWSDDGARTWSTLQKWRSMGKEGAYQQRLRWLRLGQFRTRTLRLQVTDPVRRNILATYADLSEGM